MTGREVTPGGSQVIPAGGDGERLLVRGTNWIGDSVMSVAALRELRRLYPRSHIALMVRQWVAGIFRGQGLVDEILPAPERLDPIRRPCEVRALLEGFQRAVLFPNSFSSALAPFVAAVPHRLGYNTHGRGLLLTRKAVPRTRLLKRHQVYSYLDLLYQTGLSPHDYLGSASFQPDVRLAVPPDGKAKAEDLLDRAGSQRKGRRVVLNPGAYYGAAKRWFTDRYAALADRLIDEAGAEIVIVGAEAELKAAEEISALMKQRPLTLTGQTDLAALMGLLAGSRLFITNDSGPMHLAAALGVRQIAIFGSTDEVATGPLSERARIVHKHVECSPCLLRECPIDLRCFDWITADEVAELALQMLREKAD